MKLLIWVCLTQAVWPQALGLYHVLSKKVFLPPKPLLSNDSYFGYSITYDQAYKRLVISAPKENNIGEVYDCGIEHRNCSKIENNITRISDAYKHDYWFGATVKAGADYVVMCAPRFTEKYYRFQDYGTYSKCFVHTRGNLNLLRAVSEGDIKKDSPNLFEATMDSFGWSIDISSTNTIIVGGPGMYNGRAIIYKPLSTNTFRPPMLIMKKAYTPTFNFGYSVSSGMFINDGISYAVGSPYGKKGFGEVLFFKDVTKQSILIKKVDTEVVGSMFGAVLCAAKLSGKRTDLLVGAPTYALKSTYNLGAVYVYLAVEKGKSPAYKRTIVGKKDGSLFGSAIISLGDLNGDKWDEIAIGAPFENDGRGAVYLYSGADLVSEKTEKTLTYLQKIEPEPGQKYAYSFGMSLTSLLDYDDNGCNELAVGAPYRDSVVFYGCMAAVTVKTYTVFPNLQNRTRLGIKNFTFQVCLTVKYPTKPNKIIANLTTKVEMSHAYAKLTKADATGAFTIKTSLHEKKPSYCSDVPFALPDGNYEVEINYQISSVLDNNPLKSTNFEGSRVILSDRSVLNVLDSIWAAECAGDKECVPKLNLTSHFNFLYDDHKYIIGSSEKESFEMSLVNSGEVAYDACLHVHIVGAHLFQMPAPCERMPTSDGDRLLCAPTKPLRTNANWTTGSIVLEMTHLTNLVKNITVDVVLYNRCKGAPTKNITTVIPLKGDPKGIVIKGITDIGDVVNMKKNEILKDGKQMQHVYTIENHGRTNWEGLTATVALQKKPFIKYNEEQVSIYFSTSNSRSECLQTKNSTGWMYFECKIDTLTAKLHTIKIVIPMYVVPGTLGKLLENSTETIITNITLSVDGYPDIRRSIVSFIRLRDAAVPLWVIILATLVGLAILVIIAFALYECGFLQRKNKQNLEQLRRSVKRQTILRRSTMPTQPQPTDRRQILERMSEENEDVHHGVDNLAGPK